MGEKSGPGVSQRRLQLSARWSSRLGGVRLVAANRALRRLAVSWGLVNVAEYAFVVALGVYAFGEGGTIAVGLVALVRTLPGLVSGPLASVATDRWKRSRVLIMGVSGRLVVSVGIVVSLIVDQPYAVYSLAAVDATLAASFWPAMAAMTAEFSHRPAELTAANATSSLMESFGSLVGPVVAGTMLLFGSPEWIFVLGVGLFGAAIMSAVPLRSDRVPAPAQRGQRWREIAGGWSALRETPAAGRVVALWGGESLVLGSVDVVVVVLAIEYLDIGESGVGYLAALGGLGGMLAAGLVSVVSHRSGRLMAMGLVGFGLSLTLLGAVPSVAVAFLVFGTIGAAASVIDVGAQTLLQRLVPDARLGRVLGLFEGLYWASLGLGGLLASVLIVATSAPVAIGILGGLLLILGVANLARLDAIDGAVSFPRARLSTLSAMPMLARLSAPTLERLARRSADLVVPAGEMIIRQGDVGELFYVIASGTVEVDGDGQELAQLIAGDGFGEIALLKNQPRNADVVSVTDTRLVSIPAADFCEAVTGHAGAMAAAEALVAARLAGRTGRHRVP